jgi:two-component system, chemotaxis family, chemotaxis protein CheY
MFATDMDRIIEQLGILVVDPNAYMRKLTRSMLVTVGARAVYETADGLAALDVIRTSNPDVLLMDWELPALSGSQVMRIIRAPDVFPRPNLPVIMLTGSANRAQVHEAMLLGVHEFLLKPTSPQALRDRLTSILVKPRPMVKIGKYYVPEPRRPIAQSEIRRAA